MPIRRARSLIAVTTTVAALLGAVPALAGEAGVGVELGPGPDLVRFDTAAPGALTARVPVTGLAVGESVVGIDVRPATGELWALTSQDRLVKIDVDTGQTQQQGTPVSGLTTNQDVGFDFDPVADVLRIVTADDEIVDVDPTTFVASPEDQVDPASAVIATAYTSSGAPTLFGVDVADSLVQIASTGELTAVGPLGVDVEGGGFDVVGANAAFAALYPPVGASSALYAVDLGSGQLAGLGTIAGDRRLGGFAVMPGGAARAATLSTAASEAAPSATVTIQRSGDALAPVSIAYRTADGSAVAGQDYSAVAGSLEFAQGERSKDVVVPLLQDAVLEGPEALSLVLGPTTGGVALDTREHTIGLVDDERSSIAITAAPDRTRPAFLVAPALPDHLRALARAKLLRVDFACSERCVVELTLKLGRATLGRALATLERAGVKRATVRLTKAGRRAVAKALKSSARGRVALKLAGVATDAAGNAARRTATLRLARR